MRIRVDPCLRQAAACSALVLSWGLTSCGDSLHVVALLIRHQPLRKQVPRLPSALQDASKRAHLFFSRVPHM